MSSWTFWSTTNFIPQQHFITHPSPAHTQAHHFRECFQLSRLRCPTTPSELNPCQKKKKKKNITATRASLVDDRSLIYVFHSVSCPPAPRHRSWTRDSSYSCLWTPLKIHLFAEDVHFAMVRITTPTSLSFSLSLWMSQLRPPFLFPFQASLGSISLTSSLNLSLTLSLAPHFLSPSISPSLHSCSLLLAACSMCADFLHIFLAAISKSHYLSVCFPVAARFVWLYGCRACVWRVCIDTPPTTFLRFPTDGSPHPTRSYSISTPTPLPAPHHPTSHISSTSLLKSWILIATSVLLPLPPSFFLLP